MFYLAEFSHKPVSILYLNSPFIEPKQKNKK